ncbi:bifunctional [glutamine synthetase] adenylyltransferase/[glutamine synthetase]-adenylyl-L-tyrosine phosphorylase [Paeniglutamicibacter antarcticus]|uniref:Bifunctional [glutamine synthetase] adenylyltransferase/[glutamine synthetase]-adenylyl-L-tyrosine phosphorylase n=1 Tax=Paeniglutamicibacter antarcticus TaxID=494023 RepID=A0ABP9TNJ6_9MICC
MQISTRQLIFAGFDDLERAKRFLADKDLVGVDTTALVGHLAHAADPDMALLSLLRLIPHAPAVLELVASSRTAPGLLRVLGASDAMTNFLIRVPESLEVFRNPAPESMQGRDGQELRAELLRAVGADPASGIPPVAKVSGEDGYRALRVAYRKATLSLVHRDLGATDALEAMPAVGRELADLAAAAIEGALAISRAEAAQRFEADDIADLRLAVIGMGKCGAHELNYVSDVDVIYVHSSERLDTDLAHALARELASGISRAIDTMGTEPGLWEVDANLRPEGKDGALSRTLESHAAYYDRWAASWEFQALLKARAIAGDAELGAAYEAMVAPLVWFSSEREGFVDSVQRMRRRVTENIKPAELSHQLKLGPGGLRDVEFTVQLLQLVHGRIDETLRVRSTTGAIVALSMAGYIGRDDAEKFDRSYRFLRVLEHRIQLVNLRRTHQMPHKEADQRVLARSVRSTSGVKLTTAAGLMQRWGETKKLVRQLHERIFYRPLLSNAANLSADEVRLSPEAAQSRLRALGYVDPKAAMRHIEALTGGMRRRAALQRQLLPVLLGWIAEGVDPDAGLLGFRRLSESLGESHWYLGMLRDSNAAAERLCKILSNSRFITDLLEVSPESTAWLGSNKLLQPPGYEALWGEVSSKLQRNLGPDQAIRLIRVIRRREILRTALADGAGVIDQDAVGRALSDNDRAAVRGALEVAQRNEFASTAQVGEFLVVAMGRQGGAEIGYCSDADVMFVQRAFEGADPQAVQEQALRIAAALGSLLGKPMVPAIQAEPRLEIDTALRPEGKSGSLVRSLAAFEEYYSRWAQIWEFQALLRAAPMAGAPELAKDFMEMVRPLRYERVMSEDQLLEIRRIKARVEAERLPRGAEPERHLKLGRGSLSDVEWLVQMMQLVHAKNHPDLRTTSTRPALAAIAAAGIIPSEEVKLLDDAWSLATKIRSGGLICTGRVSDVLPKSWRDMEAVARWCGYAPGEASVMEDDYLKATRRARQVFERYFYGFED